MKTTTLHRSDFVNRMQPTQKLIKFFPSSDMGRLIHHLDDVVSRPDALIHKARIAIQISPSGRQPALVIVPIPSLSVCWADLDIFMPYE